MSEGCSLNLDDVADTDGTDGPLTLAFVWCDEHDEYEWHWVELPV